MSLNNVRRNSLMARLNHIESNSMIGNGSTTNNDTSSTKKLGSSEATMTTATLIKLRRSKSMNCCPLQCLPPTRKTIVRRLPIVEWLPNYQLNYLQHDLVAGITAALTVIPQGIAYANLAGLPLQYGLYTSFVGLFTYCLFGTMKMIHIGPTSMMAILILQHVLVGGPAYAVWLSFLSGCVEVLFGVFRLGALVDFISLPVASGFSSAASVIVIGNLAKNIFGLKFRSKSFLDLVYKFVQHVPETNILDLSLGLICIIVLIFLKKLNEIVKELFKSQKIVPCWHRICLSLLWFVLTARNAFVVLLASVVAYLMVNSDLQSFTLSADVAPGLPDFNFPPMQIERYGETIGFFEICKDLEWGIVLVPLVAILQHIAIAKSFADEKPVDATQEVITLGLCNVLGSFVGAFPVTASFSRTALNVTSGIKTTLASSFTGGLVLVALAVLAPTFRYIPKSTLAAVIINAVFSMIEYEMIPRLWKVKRSDLAVWLTTFFGCILFEAEYGILTGITFSLLVLLYTMAKPSVSFHKTRGFCGDSEIDGEVIVVEPDRAMYFPSVEFIRYKLNKKIDKSGDHSLPVIFDGSFVSGADYTSAEGFKRMVEDFKKRDAIIIFTNFKEDVLRLIKSTDPPDFIHYKTTDEIFIAIQDYYCKEAERKTAIKSENDSSGLCSIESIKNSPKLVNANILPNTRVIRCPILHHVSSESAVLLPDAEFSNLIIQKPQHTVQ